MLKNGIPMSVRKDFGSTLWVTECFVARNFKSESSVTDNGIPNFLMFSILPVLTYIILFSNLACFSCCSMSYDNVLVVLVAGLVGKLVQPFPSHHAEYSSFIVSVLPPPSPYKLIIRIDQQSALFFFLS